MEGRHARVPPHLHDPHVRSKQLSHSIASRGGHEPSATRSSRYAIYERARCTGIRICKEVRGQTLRYRYGYGYGYGIQTQIWAGELDLAPPRGKYVSAVQVKAMDGIARYSRDSLHQHSYI
jgi:hypothetical protein